MKTRTDFRHKIESDFKRHSIIIFSIIAIVVAGSTLANHIVSHGPMEAIEAAKDTRDDQGLKTAWGKLVAAEPGNMDYQHDYLEAHFDIPQTIISINRFGSINTIRDDQEMVNQYQGYTQSPDSHLRDIGYYGLGYIYFSLEKPQLALEYLDKVSDPNLPYLNNALGLAYLDGLGDSHKAADCFYKEITVKGNVSAAVVNLSKVYWNQNDLAKIDDLRRDPALGRFVPLKYRRYEDLRQGRWLDYCRALLRTVANAATLLGVLSSLAVAVMFLGYFYFVDVFAKEKIQLFLLVFGLGLFSWLVSMTFYDLADCFAAFKETGDPWKDILYYIFGVGLFEETAKFLPVMIVAFLFRYWKEPVDILIFASLSALGFATMENIYYIGLDGVGNMALPNLYSVILHVSMTTLVAYGFLNMRYRAEPSGPIYLFGCFAGAVLVHGLFNYIDETNFCADFWGFGGIARFFLLVYFIVIYNRVIEGGLDQSPESSSPTKNIHLSLYLFYGLLGIFLIQFAVLNVRYGLGTAGLNFFPNLLGETLLMACFLTGFGQIRVIRGKWYSLWDKKWLD